MTRWIRGIACTYSKTRYPITFIFLFLCQILWSNLRSARELYYKEKEPVLNTRWCLISIQKCFPVTADWIVHVLSTHTLHTRVHMHGPCFSNSINRQSSIILVSAIFRSLIGTRMPSIFRERSIHSRGMTFTFLKALLTAILLWWVNPIRLRNISQNQCCTEHRGRHVGFHDAKFILLVIPFVHNRIRSETSIPADYHL